MEAPARILRFSAVNRRLLLLSRRTDAPHSSHILSISHHSNPRRSFPFPLSLSASHLSNHCRASSSFIHSDGQYPFKPISGPAGWSWHRPPSQAISSSPGLCGHRKDVEATVVLLGWLWAREKHLRMYVDWYISQGFNVLTFVVDVRELLWFDFGVRVENRVRALTAELASWVSEREVGGRERCLLIHSFSNTGWLVYGALLERLQGRPDVLEKIKGCIVDSGGGDPLNHKVWAAGFSAALLKKQSSAATAATDPKISLELGDDDNLKKMESNEISFIESALLSILEKVFSYVLKLPEFARKLGSIVNVLSENQPSCPQLYLYSTADRVLPSHSIESQIEAQRNTGRRVFSFNFVSSPHVDHLRAFPDQYVSQVASFLKECLATVNHKKLG